MKKFLSIVIVIAFAVITSSAINCKNDKCRESGTQQTMCKYPTSKPAAACGKVLAQGFTEEERREILEAHNMHRSFVANGFEKRGNPGPQPPASNMQILVWDKELAKVAQRWAIQCQIAADRCPHVDRFRVGQAAVGMKTTGTVTTKPSDIIDYWYNQVNNMDRNQVPRLTNNQGVNDYIQLVWAKTNRVGCGKVIYQPDEWKIYWMVCNYGPTANVFNEPVYQIDFQRINLRNNVSIDINEENENKR
ncbi:venom allergen 5-like [Osmia lignaria lignaria]|uniref:venom allergen 5-like n=1 Tax=Osmia lignaria lignaria TaxID=1437193 RepID=UPI00402B9E73